MGTAGDMGSVTRRSVSLIFIAALFTAVCGIRCYVCDNTQSRACGLDFQAYQFEAFDCNANESPEKQFKCGKQVQMPDENGYIGVARRCHEVGALDFLNDSVNHCQFHEVDDGNFSATFCVCDKDYCNTATAVRGPATDRQSQLLYLVTLLIAFLVPYIQSSSRAKQPEKEPPTKAPSETNASLGLFARRLVVWQSVRSTISRLNAMNFTQNRLEADKGELPETNLRKKVALPDAVSTNAHGTKARSRNTLLFASNTSESAAVAGETPEEKVKETSACDSRMFSSTPPEASFGERGKSPVPASFSGVHQSVAFTSAGSPASVRPSVCRASVKEEPW